MTITLADIREKFDELIRGTQTREFISAYAENAMAADDNGELDIEKENASKIWEALTYLNGVDLKDTPSTYLHSESDFIAERVRLGV